MNKKSQILNVLINSFYAGKTKNKLKLPHVNLGVLTKILEKLYFIYLIVSQVNTELAIYMDTTGTKLLQPVNNYITLK